MSATQKGLVLVTGASGYLASYIVSTLLENGYRVRGTVRPAKVALIQAAPIAAKYPGAFEVVGIEDVCTSDFSEALKGVSAVIHVASPMGFSGEAEVLIREAKEGATNLLRQALEAGVKKVVQTGTYGAAASPGEIIVKGFSDHVFSDADYGVVDEEGFHKNAGNMVWTYTATKILTEKTAWDFANAHPELDFAMVLPPFVYGPLHPDFPKATSLGSLNQIYSLISGEKGRPLGFHMPPQCMDIRDVALAHVRALDVPPRKGKRYFIWSGQAFIYTQAVSFIADKWPELKDRLPSVEGAAEVKVYAKIDAGPAERDFGTKDYIPWEKTLEDSVASLLAWETK
ncbi:NAD(P)-binding protein [Cylindrobasidium torrendii FP15055 ss-10]|uniref:NAD(P)-binding protein n=1 Tax=Cylindrobasidium torrendii FP15055 ss-10 TaxID=1314674 RepID=A0A0D7B959_9AGAR|nr:NAD(P)-binding protein [Cylindrobasidium torrendii FP15055 ss-10]